MAGIPAGMAAAAGAPYAGTYSGSSTAYNGATVELTVDANGNLTSFDSESYVYCGGFPTPMSWAELPATPVSADVPFNLEWTYSDVRYALEGVVIGSDGVATGEGYASMPSMGCQGGRFSFTAELEGGIPAPVYNPSASVTPSELSESELVDAGVVFAGEGFAPSSAVTLLVDGAATSTATADASGAVSFAYTGSLAVGAHTAVLRSVDGEASVSFTVTADVPPAPVYDPSATVTPSELSESELVDAGVVFTGEGFAPGSEVTLLIDGQSIATADADASGTVSFAYTASLAVGAHAAVLRSVDGEASVSFTVTADVPPAPVYEPEASVSDAELTETELATDGAVFTGTGFAPASAVTLLVDGVTVATETADADGTVQFTYMSNSLAVGAHTAVLRSVDGEASVEFEVVADEVLTPPVPPVTPAPSVIPAVTPTVDALVPAAQDSIDATDGARAGDTIVVWIPGAAEGDRVGVWMFSTPVYLGTQVVSADGTVEVVIPAGTTPGAHRIAAWAEDGTLLGWTIITIAADGTVTALPVTGAESALAGMIGAGSLLLLGTGMLVASRRREAQA